MFTFKPLFINSDASKGYAPRQRLVMQGSGR